MFLVAGRDTLRDQDQDALAEILPLCLERQIAVFIGGVMNSGILAGPRADSRFDYRPACPKSDRVTVPRSVPRLTTVVSSSVK